MKNNIKMRKISEMLDENKFWEIVSKSIDNSRNEEQQEKYLINEITKLTSKDIAGFYLRNKNLLDEIYNSEMWCAGTIMNGWCSDDGFEYFRSWIISRGKDVYYKAKDNPDNLIDEVIINKYNYAFENFLYVAVSGFEEKTDDNLYDYLDYKQPNRQVEFNWNAGNPETMKAICPKLYERLWSLQLDRMTKNINNMNKKYGFKNDINDLL